ncbi:MAG: class I SAM-dependent methyltransferase [Nanoarchaeota archaeon]
MPKTREDIFWEFYLETSQVVLGCLHDYLFKRISAFLSSLKEDKNLLVIGHGRYALPFSKHPEEVSKFLKEKGKLVFTDYKEQEIILAIEYLDRSGFFKRSGLKNNSFRAVKSPNDLEARTATFTRGDLREPLPFADNSFHCIDMTLAAHHVTKTLDDLDRVTSEVYRLMKPGGMLHYGEGFINIDTETKIIDLAVTIRDFLGSSILFRDDRDPENPRLYPFEFGDPKPYSRLEKRPASKTLFGPSLDDLVLDNEGQLTLITHFPNGADGRPDEDAANLRAEKLRKLLKGNNHNAQIYRDGNKLLMPLVDETSEKDIAKILTPINSLYGAIENKVRKNYKKDSRVLKNMEMVIKHEKEQARKGVDEFFKSYDPIKASLKRAGFKKVEEFKRHEKSPFISVIAFK